MDMILIITSKDFYSNITVECTCLCIYEVHVITIIYIAPISLTHTYSKIYMTIIYHLRYCYFLLYKHLYMIFIAHSHTKCFVFFQLLMNNHVPISNRLFDRIIR